MPDPLIIAIAFIAGFALKRLGFPPMLGYLFAGFAIHLLGIDAGTMLHTLADAGITLLLFTIGLKLNLRDLAAPHAWGVAGVHMVVSIAFLSGVFMLLALWLPAISQLSPTAIWTVAFALSFSSTVLAVKVFEAQGETVAIHAKVAIAILVIQDLIAVVFMAMNTGKIPDYSALLLLLLIPCRPLLHRLLALCGHGELLIIFGFVMAFGGAALFEAFHVKGDLGAIIMGVLLSGCLKTNELSKNLLNFKDIFLVGFFLTIGLGGLPETEYLIIAAVLGLIVGFKPLLYYGLMVALKLRARTSLLASLALFNYSEFGLIVAGAAVSQGLLTEQWLSTIALALAVSFFIAVPLNSRANGLYNRYANQFSRYQRRQRIQGEEAVDLGNAKVLVLGMGRVGSGAYDYFNSIYPNQVAGVEENPDKLKDHQQKAINVYLGDASDRDFWDRAHLNEISLIVISLTNHTENIAVVKLLRNLQYTHKIAVIARFPDEKAELETLGCISYNMYAEAGYGFAEHVEVSRVEP